MFNYLLSNKMITENQFGFRPGDSTISQLLKLTNNIYHSLKQKSSLEFRAIFLNISKASDYVWPSRVSGNILQCWKVFYQIVNNEKYSIDLMNGVPQKSILRCAILS